MTPTQLHARLLRLAEAGGVARAVRPAVVETSLEAERNAKQNATGGGARLNVRTGRLRASIAGAVRDTQGAVELVLRAGGSRGGQDVKYAAIHEYGGEIRPVNGRYLRIPTLWALTAAGVDRYPTPLRQTAPGAFRVVGSDRGLWLVPTKTGKGGLQEPPWYKLVERVTIPARPYLRPAIMDAAAKLPARTTAALRRALGGDGG